jgi:predicted DNA-binding protein with PD1-like motif
LYPKLFQNIELSPQNEERNMAIVKRVKPVVLFMGKLSHGSDLLAELTDLCTQKDVHLGRIEALGAVQRARLGFYNQKTREYEYVILDRPLEITKLVGNVSIKDDKPMVHAHITLADDGGIAYGGHLASGTVVFACEFILQAFDGPVFERAYDSDTGLPLWKMADSE